MPGHTDGAALNLVLTGFMGTGKSAVGRALASRLGRRFLDTDAVIAHRHGPIPAIFSNEGEAAFRRYERGVAIEVGRACGLVVATGGRMLLDRSNATAITATGIVVCLTASPAIVVARVTADGVKDRPLLDVDDPAGRVAQLLAERASAYARFPQVATDHLGPMAVAERILATWPIR